MLQTSNAVPKPRIAADGKDGGQLEPLLRLAGTLRESHALVVAEHGLELLCGLLGRGCLAATAIRLGDKPDANDYDVVIMPSLASIAMATVVRLARRSLAPGGRLIVGMNDARTASALARRLRLNGFTKLRLTQIAGRVLLCADLRRVA